MSGTIAPYMPTRVLSIDALRGLTIALMILLTDLVFPNFLFLVGASIILSLHSRIRRGESRRTLALHILRRSAIIFAIDIFFGLYPHFRYTHLRLYGVLTRIALCYLCAGLICLVMQRASRLL